MSTIIAMNDDEDDDVILTGPRAHAQRTFYYLFYVHKFLSVYRFDISGHIRPNAIGVKCEKWLALATPNPVDKRTFVHIRMEMRKSFSMGDTKSEWNGSKRTHLLPTKGELMVVVCVGCCHIYGRRHCHKLITKKKIIKEIETFPK